ncbi:CTTNBP2 N-terminal-like protein isoform X2 [Ornithodoros turicata]|uniref:CTTNBP2 N-terminal-like protein isoform X2 n=1 Tax=Ornithodoros turicata TaxID=34597 RepID=UPI0031398054
MAGRGVLKSQPGSVGACSYEGFEKLTSSTLKRHPKMELSKADLVKLLSVLEGELQAREIVIAVLKAEQVKQLLYPNKTSTNGNGGTDPWASLQRDVLGAYDGRFDAAAVKALHGMQLRHLENLIGLHRRVQNRTREDLKAIEQRCTKLCKELEDEKAKRMRDLVQGGGDNAYSLEKERDRLRQEMDFERQQNRRLDKDLKQVSECLEQERSRQKQIVLLLLAERKRLILRLMQERQRSEHLLQILKEEKSRSADMVEGLEEESKKSLQMEEELERQAAEFELERERYQSQVVELKALNAQQQLELERLRSEAERAAAITSLALGEGVRSTTVVTPSSAPPPTIRAAVPAPTPPRGVAVGPKAPPSPKPPVPTGGLVPQVPPKPGQRPVSPQPPAPLTTAATATPPLPVPSVASAPTPGAVPPVVEVGTIVRTPPKKAGAPAGGVAGRPTPPPVPPNKPVLQRKDLGPKPPVPPRTMPDAQGGVQR